MAFVESDTASVREDGAYIYLKFTGGDAAYSRNRYVRVVVSPGSLTFEATSREVGGADSDFTVNLYGLNSGTRYTWTATLGYEDSKGQHWTTTTCRGSFTTAEPAKQRPSDWIWRNLYTNAPLSNLTATQWNGFCDRINEFREYKNLGQYSFRRASGSLKLVGSSKVTSSQLIYRVTFNEAREAISDIPGHGTLPHEVYADWRIYYDSLNMLATALNAVD